MTEVEGGEDEGGEVGEGGGGALKSWFRILDLSLAERFMCWRNLFGGW